MHRYCNLGPVRDRAGLRNFLLICLYCRRCLRNSRTCIRHISSGGREEVSVFIYLCRKQQGTGIIFFIAAGASAKLQGARRSLTHLSKDAWDLKEVLRTMPLESL